MKKKRPLYIVNTALACGVLYYVLRLSQAGRGFIDWMVIALVVGGIAWNVAQLGRRLAGVHGSRAIWRIGRTLALWSAALLTVPLSADGAVWQHLAGYGLVALATVDTFALLQIECRVHDFLESHSPYASPDEKQATNGSQGI